MENPMAGMYKEMVQDLEKLSGKWLTDFQEKMSKWTQDLLKDAFDPAKMMQFLRGMGVDMSQLPNFASAISLSPKFDPYVVLGLEKSASDEEVKQAYRKVMNRVHPDKAGPELKFMATIANAAYELIEKERKWK
ncbi:Co-chaperone protein DjlA [subsurface metagenome]